MARMLVLLTILMACAGCATAPAPPSSTAPSPPAQVSRADAAQAAKNEVDALRPTAAPPPPPPASGVGGRPAERPKETFAVSGEDQLQTQVENWFTNLSQGNIQYKIPDTMLWKEASTVSVAIQGPQAPASSGLAGATGTGQLKVSNRMRVVVSSPDNPDEFAIAPEGGTTEIQFVPTNGSTTWSWSVIPKYTGRSQRLQVQAWVLYPGQDDKILLQLPVYTSAVNVNVPGFAEAMKRLVEGDPDYWLKYGLPGGGGFVFVAGVIGWFFKRKSDKKKRP
jgi:hypothetical protein